MLETKVKKCTAEDVKAENPSVYEEIKALGKDNELVSSLKAENEKLKEENQSFKRSGKISAFAAKLGLEEKGNELIDSNCSVEEAYEALASAIPAKESVEEESASLVAEATTVFEATASDTAGEAEDHMDSEPKTWKEAVAKVQERDGCSKSEAIRKATKEYKSIHASTFKQGSK